MIPKIQLHTLYNKGLSMQEIADRTHIAYNTIVYWMRRYQIPRRTRSEATYVKHNPNGDPFHIKTHLTQEEQQLFGIGLGLYWGEGSKRSTNYVKLGNTDPYLILKFIEFLETICGVDKQKLKFGLQIFNDTEPQVALQYWRNQLNVPSNQFYKITVTPARGKGTYRHKNLYGVLAVCFLNKKLKELLVDMLSALKD